MPKQVLQEILSSINQVDGYGSIEIVVQDFEVTQITVKKIKKLKYSSDSKSSKNDKILDQTLDKAISIY